MWKVFRFELMSLLKRPGFWIGIFIMPIIVGVVMGVAFGAAILATMGALWTRQPSAELQGYVDRANVINPAINRSASFVRYDDEPAAQRALASDAIGGYFLIPADFVGKGEVRYISKTFSPFANEDKTDLFLSVLRQDLLKVSRAELNRIDRPLIITQRTALQPVEVGTAKSNLDGPPVPMFVALIFFTALFGSSSLLINTISSEKENRIMEVLLTSISPLQLLTGKILAMGSIGIVQLLIWLASALNAIWALPDVSKAIGPIPSSAIVWGVIYFVFGYLIYASLMAGLGALMPAAKEANQYTLFLMIPLILPVYISTALMAAPNGTLSVALSLFPLTSPLVMVMRLMVTPVPLLQLLLGLGLLMAAAALVLWLVSRLFRAQVLLSSTKPALRRLFMRRTH
ncbi:MAG: ABC transporter permease [Anaerolineae bacterium]|nr:ABC transporter permease [Anaerolineae bacterium]